MSKVGSVILAAILTRADKDVPFEGAASAPRGLSLSGKFSKVVLVISSPFRFDDRETP